MKYAKDKDSRSRSNRLSAARLAEQLAHLAVTVVGVGYRARVDCNQCGWTSTTIRMDEVEAHVANH